MSIDKREKQLVPIEIGKGMNEAVADEALSNSSLRRVENAYYDTRGKLKKRHGTTLLNTGDITGNTRTAGRRLGTFRDTVVVFDGYKASVYSPTTNTCSDMQMGSTYSIDAYPIVGGSGSPVQFQSIQNNGYIVCAYYYSDSEYVIATVLDEATKSVVVQPVQLGQAPNVGGSIVRLAAANTSVHVIWSNAAASTINSSYINLASATTINSGFQTGLGISDFDSTLGTGKSYWDSVSGATEFFVAYPDDGAVNVEVKSFDDTGTTTGYGNVASGAVHVCLALGDDLWVTTYGPSSNVNTYVLDAADLTTTVATQTDSVSERTNGYLSLVSSNVNTNSVILVTSDNVDTAFIQLVESGGSISNVYAEGSIDHWQAVSKPFTIGSATHVVMRHSDASNGYAQGEKTFVVANIADTSSSFTPISGVFTPRLGDFAAVDPFSLGSTAELFLPGQLVHDTADGFKAGLFPRKKLVNLSGTDDGISFDYVVFSTDPSEFHIETVEHADSLYVTAGVTEVFDGLRFAEVNFVAPPAVTFAGTATGGNVTGTVLYVAVFEYVDASGAVHWSEPSVPSSVTVTNKTVNVNVRSLSLTNKTSDSDTSARNQIAIYRTAASGTTYYRVGSIRDSGADQVFVDDVADATLVLSQKLYTQPGTPGTSLVRQCPPASKHICNHQDRIFCDDETGITLWYSAPRVGGEAVWFNNEFTIPIEDGGRITGCASFDNRLLVFKRGGIYVISGYGPPENGGSGNEFSPPYRLPDTNGCKDARSILVTNGGVFYQSDQGIEFLDRRLRSKWIGEPVKDTLATYPHITSAIAYTDDRIAFSCRDADTIGSYGNGCILVYHQRLDAWAVYLIEGSDGTANIGIEHMAMLELDGEYRAWLLDPKGALYVSRKSDDATLYQDSVSIVRMAVESNWVRSQASLSDRQRVYNGEVALRMVSNVSANLSFAYDYVNTYSDEVQYDETVLGTSGVTVLKKQPDTPQNMAVKFRLVETANVASVATGTGEGFEILGLALEIAPKPGAHDPAATNKG